MCFKYIFIDIYQARTQEFGQGGGGQDFYIYYPNMCIHVYHVTIVAVGHGLLKKCWPMVVGCVLRTSRSSLILKYTIPLIYLYR